MKIKSLVLIVLIVGLSLSKTFGQSPVEFNNQMSEIADSLFQKGNNWGKQLGEIAATSKQFEKLAPIRLSLEKYIFNQTTRLNEMKDVSGSYNFRQAMITYLQFEKQMVDSLIKPFESLSSASTDAVFKETVDKLLKGAAKEQGYLDQVHIVENEYAKANNFIIKQPAKN